MPYSFPYNDQGQLPSVQGILGGVASASNGIPVLQVSAVNSLSVATSPLSADSSSVSAKQGDAGLLRVSAIQQDAANLMISAKSNDASLFRVSALGVTATSSPLSADSSSVSAKQGDAGLLRVSAIAATVSAFINQGTVSAYSPDAALFRVSGIGTFTVSAHEVKQSDAASLRVSAIIDSGSVSARSGDANQVHVSAVQLDAGLLLVSAKTATATNFPVSSTQGDASLLRASAFQSVATTNTGGASFFSTSAGIAQVSTVKSSGGRLYGYHLYNPAGVDQYLQVFNVSGGATLGTDAPALVLGIPTLGGAVMSLGVGIAFGTGIQIAATSTAAGNTAGASAVRVNMFYA